MSASWGSWSSNDRLQCGVEVTYSPGTVTHATTSVTVTTKVYLRSRYASYENGSSTTWWITGSVANGSGNTDWNVGNMGIELMGTTTQTVTLNYGSTQSRTGNGRIHSYYAYPGTEATATQSVTIPARPYDVPAACSGVSATRNSDTQATVNWTNNPTTGEPYTSHTLQMRTYTGSSWSSYSTIASPSATATSYVVTGLSANHKYQFQIRANNSVGSSAYVATGEVYMTPGAPSSASASKDPSGSSITVSWVPTAYTSGTVTHQIERSVAGGAYASVVTGIAQGTNSWQDNSPGAGTNQYKVYAKTSTGPLTSAGTESNSVSTTVAPLAPTNLSPSGVAVDLLNTNVTLTWTHNHGGDGAAQTHYTIEKSTDGGSNWTALASATDIASSTSSHTITAGTLANGTTYLWKVKTEGIVSAGYGPFSASATLVGSAKPVATITTGYPPATLNALPLELRWTYAQDQGSPQAEWEADLLDDARTTILEHLSGSGDTADVTFSYPLVTATGYDVRVRVKSGAGLWGDWSYAETDFALLPPAAITTTATYDMCSGQMVLNLVPDTPEDGVTVSADYAKIERRVAGGDWVVITPSVAVPTDIADPLPLTNGTNEYRVTSISGSPSYYVNAIVEADGTDGTPGSKHWVFLSWGDGFATTLRFQGDPKTGSRSGRVRDAREFLGRSKSVLLLGDNTRFAVTASGKVWFDTRCSYSDPLDCTFDSPPREWERAGQQAGMVCYRDYTGRRFFGMLSDVDANDDEWPGHGTVSFSVTETGFAEGYV